MLIRIFSVLKDDKMNNKGQTIFQNAILFLFIVVGVIIIAILSSVTTPILQNSVSMNNITGGMGIVASYYNIILVMAILFVGLIIVYGGGRVE